MARTITTTTETVRRRSLASISWSWAMDMIEHGQALREERRMERLKHHLDWSSHTNRGSRKPAVRR